MLLMTVGKTFSQQGQRVLRIASDVRFPKIIVIEAISSNHTLLALVTPATFHSSEAHASIPRTLFQHRSRRRWMGRQI
jgi:hypothetical protein